MFGQYVFYRFSEIKARFEISISQLPEDEIYYLFVTFMIKSGF
jgi:hypothetical protein